jgi:hypothetical protein
MQLGNSYILKIHCERSTFSSSRVLYYLTNVGYGSLDKAPVNAQTQIWDECIIMLLFNHTSKGLKLITVKPRFIAFVRTPEKKTADTRK